MKQNLLQRGLFSKKSNSVGDEAGTSSQTYLRPPSAAEEASPDVEIFQEEAHVFKTVTI